MYIMMKSSLLSGVMTFQSMGVVNDLPISHHLVFFVGEISHLTPTLVVVHGPLCVVSDRVPERLMSSIILALIIILIKTQHNVILQSSSQRQEVSDTAKRCDCKGSQKSGRHSTRISGIVTDTILLYSARKNCSFQLAILHGSELNLNTGQS